MCWEGTSECETAESWQRIQAGLSHCVPLFLIMNTRKEVLERSKSVDSTSKCDKMLFYSLLLLQRRYCKCSSSGSIHDSIVITLNGTSAFWFLWFIVFSHSDRNNGNAIEDSHRSFAFYQVNWREWVVKRRNTRKINRWRESSDLQIFLSPKWIHFRHFWTISTFHLSNKCHRFQWCQRKCILYNLSTKFHVTQYKVRPIPSEIIMNGQTDEVPFISAKFSEFGFNWCAKRQYGGKPTVQVAGKYFYSVNGSFAGYSRSFEAATVYKT